MPEIKESPIIKDVQIVTLQAFGDARGRFMEMFRKEWFPQRSWNNLQTNRSDSQAGVLRGLHYHFHQVDYWYVAAGQIRAGLVDLRPNSPTYKANQTIDMSADNPMGLFIPVGVAHGFVALTSITLMYVVDNYYTGGDEFGVAWNDPEVGPAWGVTDPIVSARDVNNPFLRDISPEHMPR